MKQAVKTERAHLDIGYELPPTTTTLHPSEPTALPAALPLKEVARLPVDGDNVAIACRRLERGTLVAVGAQRFALDHTVLEGHRFAVTRIAQGAALLSWGLPFGYALRDFDEGTYVINKGVLEALQGRHLDIELPHEPNFYDEIPQYNLNRETFVPAPALPRLEDGRCFEGFERPSGRGVGTRNYIIVLSTNSKTGSYCQQLVKRVRAALGHDFHAKYGNVDGVVAVTHTEGGDDSDNGNNSELVVRTLSGFIVNPNVGAALIVDAGSEGLGVSNAHLQAFLDSRSADYALAGLPHKFLSLSKTFEEDLVTGQGVVMGWLAEVDSCRRTKQPLSKLKVVLQCGGSDAFSGVSGNPLAAWVGKQIIRRGGMVGMAETDELIGAEAYFLKTVRDLGTADKFLSTVDRFKERVAWHGESAEGNPSGGNKLRGLYNITLKSLGASVKRDPEVPLDYVIEYSELMKEPGFYFMDSPGNDIESIAGQVASGANMIFFITGNGSVTNFPFVPTIKIVTTTGRYQLLSSDMDVNAGLYLDGQPMAELGAETLDLVVDVASGLKSVGEKAGHSQVQLWRNWKQVSTVNVSEVKEYYQRLIAEIADNNHTIQLKPDRQDTALTPVTFRAWPNHRWAPTKNEGVAPRHTGPEYVVDRVGLVLPTSLCSGQVAALIAQQLNESGGINEEVYSHTLLGYLLHPSVSAALLLEHGCEKTHNHAMMEKLARMHVPLDCFGWASVQMDGGIEKAKERVEEYFVGALHLNDDQSAPSSLGDVSELSLGGKKEVGLEHLSVGMLTAAAPRLCIPPQVAKAFAAVAKTIAGEGGVVVVPSTQGLLSDTSFLNEIVDTQVLGPSLLYGQTFQDKPGHFHVMQNPTTHWVEMLTGLGATGVELLVAFVPATGRPLQANPLVPLLQVTYLEEGQAGARDNSLADFDLVLESGRSVAEHGQQILELMAATASLDYVPKLFRQGNVDFQLTRGELGVSL